MDDSSLIKCGKYSEVKVDCKTAVFLHWTNASFQAKIPTVLQSKVKVVSKHSRLVFVFTTAVQPFMVHNVCDKYYCAIHTSTSLSNYELAQEICVCKPPRT